jgi:hypothetical protein
MNSLPVSKKQPNAKSKTVVISAAGLHPAVAHDPRFYHSHKDTKVCRLYQRATGSIICEATQWQCSPERQRRHVAASLAPCYKNQTCFIKSQMQKQTASPHHLLRYNAALVHAALHCTSDCADELGNFEL